TAAYTASALRASRMTGVAPSSTSRARPRSDFVVPITWCPPAVRFATSGRPIAPVAPATKTFIVISFSEAKCNLDARGYNSENGKTCISVSRTRLSVRRHGEGPGRDTRLGAEGVRRGGLGAGVGVVEALL